MWSLIKRIWRTDAVRPDGGSSAVSSSYYSQDIQTAGSPSEERFRAWVIATHEVAVLIKLGVLCAWYWYEPHISVHTEGVFTYVLTATAALIFLVESRVKKNELAKTLVINQPWL
jgi:hypothetical protein